MPVELFVRDVGTGAPVVLLHAFPLFSAMWLAQREGLGANYRVLTPDLRGFGGSPLGDDPPSLAAMADDVAALLDTRGIDSAVVGGLSMGGYVAMAFLRRHLERACAVVLADTKAAPDTAEAAANRERIAALVEADPESPVLVDELLPKLVGPTTVEQRPLVYGRIRALVQSAPATAVAWAQRAMARRPDSFETLRAVAVPVLVIVGEEDVLSPLADAAAMVGALKDGGLVTIPRAGHLSAVEAPDPFNTAVAEFLGSRG